MNDLTLFQIAAEYRSMAERLADTDLDDQTILDTLEGESGALVEKGQNVAFVVCNLEASAEAIKAAEARMAARRKAIENRAERLRKYLLEGMKLANIQRIDSPYFAIKQAKNPKRVVIFDEKQIPADYMTDPKPPEPAPDKRLIKAALEDGFDVPGCKLEQDVRLEIK